MLDWFQKRSNPFSEGAAPMVSVGQGGFLAGTHAASNLGWRPVEALTVGDQLLTFDHGMQPLVEVRRETVLVGEGDVDPVFCPLLVPQDALNNRVPMYLMPDQGVLIESDLVEDAHGDPFAVVPACALDGYRGIRRLHPGERMELIIPRFARGEVIYLEAGFLGFAPMQGDLLNGAAAPEFYNVLSAAEARDLVLAMAAAEQLGGFGAGPTIDPSGAPSLI